MLNVIMAVCTVLQTIILGFVAYSGWAITYNKVLPFHRHKWEVEFVKERKRQGMQ